MTEPTDAEIIALADETRTADGQWQRIADLTDSILTRSAKDEIERVIGIKGVQHGTE